jgi:hypothetical protein
MELQAKLETSNKSSTVGTSHSLERNEKYKQWILELGALGSLPPDRAMLLLCSQGYRGMVFPDKFCVPRVVVGIPLLNFRFPVTICYVMAFFCFLIHFLLSVYQICLYIRFFAF